MGFIDKLINPATTTEIVYTWPDGREEVRYRRPFMSRESLRLMSEVRRLEMQNGKDSPYSYRHV